jgi:hypothetical protein
MMGRSLLERFTVGFFDRVLDVLEEASLPFVMCARWMSGGMPASLVWDIFWRTWIPFRICRRLRGRWSVWWDRRYGGDDEFHRSLDMNIGAMLTMTRDEMDRYLADLCRRRQEHHDRDLDERGRDPRGKV